MTFGAPVCLVRRGIGSARNTPAAFDVFYWLQVTNYRFPYILFDATPRGSDHIEVWDLSIHRQRPPERYLKRRFNDERGP